jgi:hypothetical protein
LMAQSWGGGARGVVTGPRFVMTVGEVCERLVGAVGVRSELPGVLVEVALEMLV